MPALGLKLRLNRISARILAVITTNLQLWSKMILSPYTGGARILDASTAGNNGDAYTGRTMSFDGVNDVITIGNTAQSVRTVVIWVYPSTTTQSFCQLTASGGVDLKITSGTLSGSGWTSPTYYVNGAAGSTGITANVWRMVAVTSATAVTASDVRLGLDNTTYYGGRLSNVIFYNVELSAAQIAELYAYPEKPIPTGVTAANVVGWWPLAESVGSLIAFDGSGNNNNGTISGATDSLGQNGAVPQWGFVGNNWPMFHDGSNDYVAANSVIPTTNFSLSFWLVGNRLSSQFLLWFTSTNSGRFAIGIGSSERLEITDGTNENYMTPASSFLLRKIYHVVVTMNTTSRLSNTYINGALSATYTFTDFNWGTVASSNYEIGRNNPSVPFGGVVFNHGVYDSILSANEVSALYSAGINHDLRTSTGNYTSTANLKGYWVNTGNQNSDWLDLSGNGKNGTVNGSPGRVFLPEGVTTGRDIVGMTLTHPVNGQLFLADSGYISIPDNSTLDLTSNFSIELWFKISYDAGSAYLIHKGATNGYRAYWFSNFVRMIFNTGGVDTNLDTTSSSVLPGNWTHYVCTFDGSNVRLYLNGVLNRTIAHTTAVGVNSDPLLISNTSFVGDEQYIDDVRIYSSVLTAAQILNNYKATKAAHS